MLIISRRPNQVIEIDGGIVLTILDISGQRVRLGIEAPAGTRIYRQEAREEMERKLREREQGDRS